MRGEICLANMGEWSTILFYLGAVGLMLGVSHFIHFARAKGDKDSIIYYAQMQMDYKDSVSNQKRNAEFQNMTFAQQLKDIDEPSKIHETNEQRRHNIQYASIALGIIVFICIFLLLSRSIIVNEKWI